MRTRMLVRIFIVLALSGCASRIGPKATDQRRDCGTPTYEADTSEGWLAGAALAEIAIRDPGAYRCEPQKRPRD
jgi:hypothetical protein